MSPKVMAQWYEDVHPDDDKVVKLNVGGECFYTTAKVLCKYLKTGAVI
jgi:hypothetical protein